MSILDESIIFNDTPFFERSFEIKKRTSEECVDIAYALMNELKDIIDNTPFFKGRTAEKLSKFLILAHSSTYLAMLEGADLYMYTDDTDNVIIYMVAPCFYLRRSAMISLTKICLSAIDMAISTPDNAEECVISFGFDFSKS